MCRIIIGIKMKHRSNKQWEIMIKLFTDVVVIKLKKKNNSEEKEPLVGSSLLSVSGRLFFHYELRRTEMFYFL